MEGSGGAREILGAGTLQASIGRVALGLIGCITRVARRESA